eukprot:m.68644 g.68644  ORF g.68644 m.68644 type:complete len:164 (+) comp11987_c0_seq3:137-628(+)
MLSVYEKERQERLNKNQQLLQSLGLQAAKQSLALSAMKTKSKLNPVKRGISASRKRKATQPTRRSSRLKGEQAEDMFVSSESKGKVSVGGSAAAKIVKQTQSEALQEIPDPIFSRLPEKTLSLDSTGGTTVYGKQFITSLKVCQANLLMVHVKLCFKTSNKYR